jgi:endoglucanase
LLPLSDPAFPANLPRHWDRHWGYLYKQGTAPVLLGEFGTRLNDESDRRWLTTLTRATWVTAAG